MEPASVTGAVAPGERHADDFRGNSGARQVDQILRGEFRPVQRRGWANVKDGARVLPKGGRSATLDGKQFQQRVQAVGREGASDDWLFRIPEHEQQAVPVADLSWGTSLQTMAVDCAANCGSISATCTSRTRSADMAGRACCGLRVENVQARGTGVEMNIVATVVHGWFSHAVVEAESARGEIEETTGERFRDVGDAVFHRDAGAAQQVDDVGSDADAGDIDQLKGLVEDAFDERLVEQFKFRSHVFDPMFVDSEPCEESIIPKHAVRALGVLRLRWPCALRTADLRSD